MKKVKISLGVLIICFGIVFTNTIYSQNGSSANQVNKSKNATGTNNTVSNAHKSKGKASRNKAGSTSNLSSADDNLPTDSTDVVPAIILSKQK